MINPESLKEIKESGGTVEEVVDKIMSNYGTPYFLDRESAHFSYGRDLHRMHGCEENQDLYNWAQSKKISKQSEEQQEKFLQYIEENRGVLRGILKDIVEEEFSKD